jgi:hypothetical protein
LEEKLIALNRVQKVHRGGRTLRWSALVVVGDGQGTVGVGLGKSQEVPEAVRKGAEDAGRTGQDLSLGSTIPHPIEARFGAAGAAPAFPVPASSPAARSARYWRRQGQDVLSVARLRYCEHRAGGCPKDPARCGSGGRPQAEELPTAITSGPGEEPRRRGGEA